MKDFYKWAQFEKDVTKILKFLEVSGWQVADIYGVPRGGLTLAVRLSYALDKPLVLDARKVSSRTLVVDDIVDSGATLREFMSLLGHLCSVVSLHKRPELRTPYPHFAPHETPNWVVYPWEHDESRSKYDGTH